MARYNELQVGRFNRFAQKLFSMKGPASVAQLEDSLRLVVPLFYGVENRYLEGWDQFGLALSITAAAGQNSTSLLRNPVGSNVIAAVQAAVISGGTAMTPFINYVPAATAAGDQPTARTPRGLDNRGRASPTCIVTDDNGGNQTPSQAGGVTIGQNAVTGTSSWDLLNGVEVSLPPGSSLFVTTNVAATQLIIAWRWRERFLEDSERA